MTPKRVLSVGQCGADHGGISWALRSFGAEATPASTSVQALDQLRQAKFDLVLVNRVFDADGDSGLELIRRIKADDALRATPVMLVSNYADAQQEAVKAGAEPGFGKSALGRPEMLDKVRPFLE
ncbi:MAG TPA: response regulator [Gemmataceae bacterium]|nr:response regulator [Gemmataceae bacterium]